MHHTKVKADIGLTKVISDLTLKGYVPCIPLSEHQPYDMVLYVPNRTNYPKALRFDRPSNNQAHYIKWAKDYLLMK